MKKYIPYLLAMLTVIIVFAGTHAWITRTEEKSHYFVSAETPRKNGVRQWEKLLGPPKPAPKPNPALLASIKPVINQPDKIRYEYTTTDTLSGEDVNYTIEDQRNMDADSVASGTIKILGYATAMLTEPPKPEDIEEYDAAEVRTKYVFWHPDGSPMDEASVLKIAPNERKHISGVRADGHRFKIFCEIHGLDSPRVVTQRLFDRRTRASLSGSYGSSSSNGVYWVDYDMHCWRSMPCDWVVDIAHGPVQTQEIEPVEGATADFEDVQLRLLMLTQGNAYRWSHGGGNPSNLEIGLKDDGNQNGTLILYAVSPDCRHRSMSLEILDAEGKVINSRDLHESSANLGMADMYNITLDQIARIRVIYRPHTRRVILPIDTIPGQPEVNRDIKNLADVRIPYVRFEHSSAMENAIDRLLQARVSPSVFRNKSRNIQLSFPRDYTNVSAGDLLDDWASQYPGSRAYIDEEDGRIEIRQPKTIMFLKEFFREIFR